MIKVLIAGVFVIAALNGCKTRTVVYTSPRSQSTTYVRTPGRVVTNTVYVKDDDHPTSLPGAARRLPEPGEPQNFPAATQ